MDRNKLQVLRDLPYVLRPSCGMCLHADISPTSDWGTCGLHTYVHEKHTGDPRQLSINRYGSCPQVDITSQAWAELHAYREFIPPAGGQ